MNDSPIVGRITRESGIAGQFALRVVTQYPGEPARTVRFYGNTYGGPIVMVTNGLGQVAVSQEVRDRIGSELTPEWVRAFFAPSAPWN